MNKHAHKQTNKHAHAHRGPLSHSLFAVFGSVRLPVLRCVGHSTHTQNASTRAINMLTSKQMQAHEARTCKHARTHARTSHC
jgi:hypothetical protein